MFTTAAIVYTLGSVTIPSLASVYNEFALKKHMETSVHEQNFFLYFYGALFNLLGVFGVMAFSNLSWSAIFYGHSKVSPHTLLCCSLGILHHPGTAHLNWLSDASRHNFNVNRYTCNRGQQAVQSIASQRQGLYTLARL